MMHVTQSRIAIASGHRAYTQVIITVHQRWFHQERQLTIDRVSMLEETPGHIATKGEIPRMGNNVIAREYWPAVVNARIAVEQQAAQCMAIHSVHARPLLQSWHRQWVNGCGVKWINSLGWVITLTQPMTKWPVIKSIHINAGCVQV